MIDDDDIVVVDDSWLPKMELTIQIKVLRDIGTPEALAEMKEKQKELERLRSET